MPKSTEELMHLEARRNFLRDQAIIIAKKINFPAPQLETVGKSGEDKLEAEIKQLEDYLNSIVNSQLCVQNPDLALSIKIILLPKIGEDTASISKTLALRFAQLSKKDTSISAVPATAAAAAAAPVPAAASKSTTSLPLPSYAPFVNLDEAGVHFFWKDMSDAYAFSEALRR